MFYIPRFSCRQRGDSSSPISGGFSSSPIQAPAFAAEPAKDRLRTARTRRDKINLSTEILHLNPLFTTLQSMLKLPYKDVFLEIYTQVQ